jgi:hypothetical protein
LSGASLCFNSINNCTSLLGTPIPFGIFVGGSQVAIVTFLSIYLSQPFVFKLNGNDYFGSFTNNNINF